MKSEDAETRGKTKNSVLIQQLFHLSVTWCLCHLNQLQGLWSSVWIITKAIKKFSVKIN